jgi:hypothetical protein
VLLMRYASCSSTSAVFTSPCVPQTAFRFLSSPQLTVLEASRIISTLKMLVDIHARDDPDSEENLYRGHKHCVEVTPVHVHVVVSTSDFSPEDSGVGMGPSGGVGVKRARADQPPSSITLEIAASSHDRIAGVVRTIADFCGYRHVGRQVLENMLTLSDTAGEPFTSDVTDSLLGTLLQEEPYRQSKTPVLSLTGLLQPNGAFHSPLPALSVPAPMA